MECFYCKGNMKKGTTTYVVNRKGYHLVLDQVPAYVCGQCGEASFEADGVEMIQDIVRDLDMKSEKLVMHAY
ncbi:MAG: type II toxin-antitoxin system MqsA family antitoxin [Deltaproteobacteria bacterium]|nr:MAG: type II toxin-antitoxin system MqsA family antitoxin [Deltaproteobacteria bacterium]